jgi:hypothetical protein
MDATTLWNLDNLDKHAETCGLTVANVELYFTTKMHLDDLIKENNIKCF